MVFKLVRIDTNESYKVILPVGKHIIGREKFLVSYYSDNRISRNHAELDVTEDSVSAKSLHINPCFFKKKDTDEILIIKKDSTISLNCGDRFGLLPETYWFELLYVLEDDEHNNKDIVENRTEEVETDVCRSDETRVVTTADLNTTTQDNINDQMNDTTGDGGSPDSQSLLNNQSSTQEFDPSTAPSSQTGSAQTTPVKRAHSSQDTINNEVKKIKTEPGNGDFNMAGPSNEQENNAQIKPKTEANDSASQSPAQDANKPRPRERCMYGANCYRRNPQHKVEFSHPQDPDWDENQRQCPYGANCRRRHPQHWQSYTHPPGVSPPDPNRPGMRVVERHGNTFYINAQTVNFYDDHIQAVDSDGNSVDYDYEF